MARSGSLPWLLLAAILATLFAIFMDGAFVAPVAEAFMGTSVWQTNHNQYSYAGKRMIGQFVTNLLTIIAVGIWIGVLIDARRSL